MMKKNWRSNISLDYPFNVVVVDLLVGAGVVVAGMVEKAPVHMLVMVRP